ncbi:MAG: hypothetical protein WCC38_17820, partial [Pseudonocardiaceae bacterium]
MSSEQIPAVDKPVDSVDKPMFNGSENSPQRACEVPKGADIARAALEAARASQRSSGGLRSSGGAAGGKPGS